MTTALRRRLSALANLTESRGATPGEAAAASAAIERIRARLRSAGEALEWLDEAGPSQGYQEHPGPARRRARRKAADNGPDLAPIQRSGPNRRP
jgi:hypothetical protein